METFFDLFDKIDLENINKILLTADDSNKIYKLYKNLKKSGNLSIVAEQVRNIKGRHRECCYNSINVCTRS